MSPKEMHSYPLVLTPLLYLLVSSNKDKKALFRNYLINEAKAMRDEPHTEADWIYDRTAIFRPLPKKPNQNELADTFLEVTIPQEDLHPASVQKNMYPYGDNRIKAMAQRSRVTTGRKIFIS